MENESVTPEFYKNQIAHPLSGDKLMKKILKSTKSL